MIKLLIPIISTFLFGNSCGNNNQKEEPNKHLIEKAVAAIVAYDTMQLYNLIDTSYCFDIYGKDGFIHKVSYVHNNLKICGSALDHSSIIIKEKPVYSTEYSIPFCRGNNGEKINNSFDLLFTFSDYDNSKKIKFFDVELFRKEIKPIIPAPPQGN